MLVIIWKFRTVSPCCPFFVCTRMNCWVSRYCLQQAICRSDMPKMLRLSPVPFMLWPWRIHCVPSTTELRNPTQVWLKKHRKKFQPSPKLPTPHPPGQAVIQQFFALAPEKVLLHDHCMYSNSASAHNNKSLQVARPLDDKGFGIRFQKGETGLQHRLWSPCSPVLLPVAKGPRNQADHTPAPNDEVDKAWNYNFTSLESLRLSD